MTLNRSVFVVTVGGSSNGSGSIVAVRIGVIVGVVVAVVVAFVVVVVVFVMRRSRHRLTTHIVNYLSCICHLYICRPLVSELQSY